MAKTTAVALPPTLAKSTKAIATAMTNALELWSVLRTIVSIKVGRTGMILTIAVDTFRKYGRIFLKGSVLNVIELLRYEVQYFIVHINLESKMHCDTINTSQNFLYFYSTVQ